MTLLLYLSSCHLANGRCLRLLRTYRRNIKSSLGVQSRLNRVEGTLLALVETSFLYCALWVSGARLSSGMILRRSRQVLFLVTGLQEPVKGKINIYGVIQPAYHTIAVRLYKGYLTAASPLIAFSEGYLSYIHRLARRHQALHRRDLP